MASGRQGGRTGACRHRGAEKRQYHNDGRGRQYAVGITSEYTKDTLEVVVQEIIEKTNDVLMFIEEQQTKIRYKTFLEIPMAKVTNPPSGGFAFSVVDAEIIRRLGSTPRLGAYTLKSKGELQ
jgi:hypothetical protein